MQHYDIAIIGAGPAGAAAAFKLAEKGISTVIVEKETLPRHKTCGGGLVYRGLKSLPIDLSSSIEREFKQIHLYFTGQDLHLTANRDFPILSTVIRKDFDKLFIDEASKLGTVLMQGQKLTGLQFKKDHAILELNDQQISAKFVIAADGAYSPTAKLAGWTKDTRTLIPAYEYDIEVGPEDWERLGNDARFDMDFIPKGYAWCFPKKLHLNIGCGCLIYDKANKPNLKEYCANYIKSLNIENVISEKSYGYQIPVSPRTDGFVKHNVFLIGDAAGFADPLTAEGISNAIYTGLLLAETIIESKLDVKEAEKLYLDKLNEKLIPELKSSLFLTNFFYKRTVIRNFLLSHSAERFLQKMTDIFMGDASYSTNLKRSFQQKIKDFFKSKNK
jgi:geranylgeranyl reductase family protein